MRDPLVASLSVSGLGMLMLFVAMCLLYGLMVGLTALIKDSASSVPDGKRAARRASSDGEREQKQRAAAIAVALARAEQDVSPIEGAPRTDAALSAWWSLHHQRQLSHREHSRILER